MKHQHELTEHQLQEIRAATTSNRELAQRFGVSYETIRRIKNGMPSRTYYSWQAMRNRCLNPNHISYLRYGALGVKICERWNSFEAFLEDMGERPKGMTLGRKDSKLDYCKDNCRWETIGQQQRNIRTNIWIEHNGERKVLQDWSRELGIDRNTIKRRFLAGAPIDQRS